MFATGPNDVEVFQVTQGIAHAHPAIWGVQDPVLDTAFRVVRDDDIEPGDARTADGAVDAAGGDELMQPRVATAVPTGSSC